MQQPNSAHDRLVLMFLDHRHTIRHMHIWKDSSEIVTSSSQRPLHTQHTTKAKINTQPSAGLETATESINDTNHNSVGLKDKYIQEFRKIYFNLLALCRECTRGEHVKISFVSSKPDVIGSTERCPNKNQR